MWRTAFCPASSRKRPIRSPARPTALAELGLLGLLLLAATAGLQALLSWLGSLGQDAPFQAMNGRSRVVGMLFEAFFYLLREGASMLTSLLTTFGVLAFVGLAFLIGWSLRRRVTAACFLLLVLVVLVGPARALERRIARGEGGQHRGQGRGDGGGLAPRRWREHLHRRCRDREPAGLLAAGDRAGHGEEATS